MARGNREKKPNAEDRQGDKTHKAFIENLHERLPESESSRTASKSKSLNDDRPIAGHHRLHEDREQHDEAEQGSEITERDRLGR